MQDEKSVIARMAMGQRNGRMNCGGTSFGTHSAGTDERRYDVTAPPPVTGSDARLDLALSRQSQPSPSACAERAGGDGFPAMAYPVPA
jgi:hypothetical protein